MRFIFLLFVFPFLSIQSDTSASDIMPWSETQPLTWADFSGEIDSGSEYDAWTYSGINYNYTWNTVDGKVVMKVDAYAFFDPAQSWVKKGKMSAELLAHEQLHFDIAQLNCLYFKKEVSGYTFTQNADAELEALYNKHFQALLDMQIQYDEESEHVKNKEGQARWSEFVKREIIALSYLK